MKIMVFSILGSFFIGATFALITNDFDFVLASIPLGILLGFVITLSSQTTGKGKA